MPTRAGASVAEDSLPQPKWRWLSGTEVGIRGFRHRGLALARREAWYPEPQTLQQHTQRVGRVGRLPRRDAHQAFGLRRQQGARRHGLPTRTATAAAPLAAPQNPAPQNAASPRTTRTCRVAVTGLVRTALARRRRFRSSLPAAERVAAAGVTYDTLQQRLGARLRAARPRPRTACKQGDPEDQGE